MEQQSLHKADDVRNKSMHNYMWKIIQISNSKDNIEIYRLQVVIGKSLGGCGGGGVGGKGAMEWPGKDSDGTKRCQIVANHLEGKGEGARQRRLFGKRGRVGGESWEWQQL